MSVLNDYLDNEAEVCTKAGVPSKNRNIASVNLLRAKDLYARSSSPYEGDIDEMVYIVNFEDDGGFALLAADNRVPDVLIGITDSGHVDQDRLAATYRKMFDNQPSTKSFDPYDPTNEDWYIGNYTGTDAGEFIVSEYVAALCVGYVEGQIGGGHIVGPITPVYGDEGYFEVVYSDGGETTVVDTLLAHYNSWEQSIEPYNDYIPNNYSVGCVNIAIGKILSYFSGPGSISGFGWSVDWNAINNDSTSTNGRASIGHLLAYLYDHCWSISFGDEGTFTLPLLASSFLSNFGYSNVSYSSYNTDTVKGALNAGCPVFVSAINMSNHSPDITKSHAWNIDGYKNKTTYRTVNYYENGILVSSSTTTQVSTLVHCAYGWGGLGDGYFTSGVFQFYTNGNYHNYCVYLKTITYSNPTV